MLYRHFERDFRWVYGAGPAQYVRRAHMPLTMVSVIFLASPSSIMVLSR